MGSGRRTASFSWLALIWPGLSAVAFNFTNTNPTQCDPLTINWTGAHELGPSRTQDRLLIFVGIILSRGTTTIPVVDDRSAYTLYLSSTMQSVSLRTVLTSFTIFCVKYSLAARCTTSLFHRARSSTMRGASRSHSSFCPSSSASCSPCPTQQVFLVGG